MSPRWVKYKPNLSCSMKSQDLLSDPDSDLAYRYFVQILCQQCLNTVKYMTYIAVADTST